jgi:flagellar biosynthesis GTPase FlhF
MRAKFLFANVAAIVAIGGLAAMPVEAPAQSKKNGKAHSKTHWNTAPPKKNGRHDNRNWAQQSSRQAEQRRIEEQRRQEEQRRLAEQRRREEAQRQATRTATSRNDSRSVQQQIDRRQRTKNEWRNIAYAAGAVTALGLLQGDGTLTFVGGAGALYALHRYEQDRKSQNQLERLRAEFFSHSHFYRDGVRYDRRLVTRNGQQYYQFVRAN